ncbi:MAG: right-handed parallel beta-helix repeat-containing protein [Pirellulaceae bacterium]|nr:right-handed parallel beta-helix repeat-containing protein [Pirellulaceae bacterium]
MTTNFGINRLIVRPFNRLISVWGSILFLSLASLAVAESPLATSNADAIPGVVGDGVQDDTQAIQKAIESGASSLRFPRGNYRLTRPIVIELDKTGFLSLSGDGVARFIMEAAGPAFRIVGTHGGTADPKSVEDKVWDRQRAPMIDGIEILGNHPEACGIEASGTMQLTLTRSVVRRVLHGVHLVQRNRNVLIANCHIYENRGVGLFLDGVDLHQINVSASHISYNDQGGIVSRQGNVRNLHISGCDIESNMSPNTSATANVLIDCSGSDLGTAEVAITGCTIQHNSKSPDSANIRIVGLANPKANQPMVRWGNVTITGNVLSDVSTNLHLKHCRGVAISGNTFWMGYRHNLLVEGSSHIVIGANNLDRNPRYDYGDASQSHNAVVFRDCDDCTVNGLHVSHVQGAEAAVLFESCRRFNIAACTILDSDGFGILLRNVENSLISSCLVRDDRQNRKASISLKIEGGADNTLANNVLSHGAESSNE